MRMLPGLFAVLVCIFFHLSGCSGTAASSQSTSSGQQHESSSNAESPSDLIFFDNFEYVVGREDPDAVSIFQKQGRWNWVKTQQTARKKGPNGYLYTVSGIPGYTGSFPGKSSSRVLAIEARPEIFDFQTDFYLQYGDGGNPAYNDAVPANAWFQFWIYINDFGDQKSRFSHRNKLIYPSRGSYPAHPAWVLQIGGSSLLPYQKSLGNPSRSGVYLQNWLDGGVATEIKADPAPHWEVHQLGQTSTKEYMAANRWTLVKIHLDTSSVSGIYEAWMRPVGGRWTKVADWRDGLTPGFTWRLKAEAVGGYRAFRMPTTVPGGGNDPLYDSWMYMDDFAIARSEAGLPRYSK